MVPNGWEKHPVGKLCKSIVPGRNKPKVFDGDIPWVTTPEISGKYIPSNKQKNFISQVVAKECGAKVVPKGAVVIAAVGELGLTAIATEEIILNQQLHAFVCPNDLDNEYLAYFLSAQKPYMDTVASKTTIPYMNKSNCESIPVLLPPLPEQRKIAKILSTWDKAIATTAKLIETSKQQKKALMQQLLTGKKRLVNPETGKAFEGEWEEVKLSELGHTFTGLTGKTKEDFGSGAKYIPYINIFNNSSVNTAKLEKVLVDSGEKQNTVQYGDVFFTTSSETPDEVGMSSVMLSEPEEPIYLNSFCFGFRPNDTTTIAPEFMQYLLRSSQVRRSISVLAQGATRYNLSKVQLLKINLLLPTSVEQKKIASVLTAADKEIELLEAKLLHFKQEKKALMQQLLTGKKRVVI
jgi:type I restriction enzyme S subunit